MVAVKIIFLLNLWWSAWRRIIAELDSYVERELLNKNMSVLVTTYSRMAWKSLNREEQRKYKRDFIKLMNQ